MERPNSVNVLTAGVAHIVKVAQCRVPVPLVSMVGLVWRLPKSLAFVRLVLLENFASHLSMIESIISAVVPVVVVSRV